MFKKGPLVGRGNRGMMRMAGLADKSQDSVTTQVDYLR